MTLYFKIVVYLLRRACNLPLADLTRFSAVPVAGISRIQADQQKGGISDKAAHSLEWPKDER